MVDVCGAEKHTVVVGATTEEQQIFEFLGVAVVEHFAEKPLAHHVANAARKLVEDFVLVDDDYIHAVILSVEVSQSFCLLAQIGIGYDDHVGSIVCVEILIGNSANVFRLVLLEVGVEDDEFLPFVCFP